MPVTNKSYILVIDNWSTITDSSKNIYYVPGLKRVAPLEYQSSNLSLTQGWLVLVMPIPNHLGALSKGRGTRPRVAPVDAHKAFSNE